MSLHLAVRHVPGTNGRFDPARICHSCKNKRHWKMECPISKAVYVKSAGLVTSALSIDLSESDVLPLKTAPSKKVLMRCMHLLSKRFCKTPGLLRVSLWRAVCLFKRVVLLVENLLHLALGCFLCGSPCISFISSLMWYVERLKWLAPAANSSHRHYAEE